MTAVTDTVVVLGPPLAGAGGVAAALRTQLTGCVVVEPAGLPAGRVPDAVVFVTSAAAPMSACDAALLAAAAGRTDAVVAAVTKIDVHRTWRVVLDANRAVLPHRAVPWVGVAASPEIGPQVIGPLVTAVRVALADEYRHRRNRLRAAEWALQRRIADGEQALARRAALQAEAARRNAVRARAAQARTQLMGAARSGVAELRADLQSEAAGASRRGLADVELRGRQRAEQLATDFDQAVEQRLGAAMPALPSTERDALPVPRRAAQEDRLAAVFGTGFGLGVALTLGRVLTDVIPGAGAPIGAMCLAVGVALTGWVVRTRRLVTARAALDRWAAEMAVAVRVALEERVLAAESAVYAQNPGPPASTGPPPVDPAVAQWRADLARVRAELGDVSAAIANAVPRS